ncbi:MAG: hypothetical protein IKJ79_03700 [Bacteroidaceae bacterium]|nr:hypothetical protein [Bacteroidaceae bacterium]
MKWNKWLDKWISLPRGQRRATLILLVVAGLLCIAQLLASLYRHNYQPPITDYSQLEEEIVLFRSQLDTIPEEERRPTYIRRTHARKDSTYPTINSTRNKKTKPSPKEEPIKIEAVPRIEKRKK